MAATTRFRHLAAIVSSCAIVQPVHALDSDRSLAQLHHTSWTAEDGAPSQVSAIAQTTDGYLWIGSARGLFRFDGVEFERYVPPGGVSLPSHNTYDLLTTVDGALWISFRPSGLGLWSNDRLTTFLDPDEIPRTEVFDLESDLDGRIFAGTREGLVIHDGARWVPVGEDWGLPPGRVQTTFLDRDGTFWVASGGRFYTLPRGSREFSSQPGFEWVSQMAQGPGDWIWLSRIDRVTAIPSPTPYSGHVPVVNRPCNDVLVDRDGCLWIATPLDGLERVRFARDLKDDIWPGDPRLESIREAQGLSADGINVLFEDREGNIWAGTAKGIDRFRHNHLVPVALPHGYAALTLVPDDEGSVWVAAGSGKEVLRVSDRVIEATDEAMAAVSAYRDEGGVIWWGVVDRVVRQDRGKFRSFPLFYTPQQERLWEIFRDDVDGGLWVSVGDYGLYHFEDGAWEQRLPPSGLPDRGPSASFHASDGSIWLGYTQDRLCVVNGDNVRAYTKADGLQIGRVRVIRGRGPTTWVGGELGLAFYDAGRFHTVACAGAEPFGTVGGIVETADGGLWLNEMRGIVHIPADEVAHLMRDSSHAVQFRRYDVQEGLPGAGQMNFNCSTAVEAADGKLWFATDGGLAWIDPGRIRTNALPPPMVVRSVTTEDGTFDPTDPIRLRNNTATLRIDYTALSLTIPERVRFRYRLEGYDEQWVDAGTRRQAFYTRLRPGPYRFRVSAANNDGVWNEAGAMVAFSIAPAFYQTTWFTVAWLGALLLSLWLAYRLRVRQVAMRLQRLHDERIDERMRIAHELHDTLLQGVLGASMQLHVARESIPPDSDAKHQVGHVLGLMDGVIGEARNAVRGLRDSESAELEQAFARIPQEIGANGQADFRVIVNGRLQPLKATARDEVYRIARESILNALRHAGARTIEAEISYLPRELRVVVRDDGRGIDADVVQGGRQGHWGLSGMRERAKRMGGMLTVRSGPGAGTEIELVVPGPVAFIAAPPANWRMRTTRWLHARVAAAREKK